MRFIPKLVMLAVLLNLMICTNAFAQERSDVTRPSDELIPPPAIKTSIDGRNVRCFDVGNGSWGELQAIIIDYQAFHIWAPKIERRLKIFMDDNEKLEDQKAHLQVALDLSTRGMKFNENMYMDERDRRLSSNTKHDVKLYLLGGTNILTLLGLAAVTTYAAIK